jgi:hypothetical protein
MFGVSARLAEMFAPTSVSAVAAESAKLLAILGENDPSVAGELTSATVSQSLLADMVWWNARLVASQQCDRIGHAATKFWAAHPHDDGDEPEGSGFI